MRYDGITYEAVFDCIKKHGPISKRQIVEKLAAKNNIQPWDGFVGGNPRYFSFEDTVCGFIGCLSQYKFIKHEPLSKSGIRKHASGEKKWFAVEE